MSSSSSSSSSSPSSTTSIDSSASPSTSNELVVATHCRICGVEAHGNHFGVVSCRACAAFFRRSWVQKKAYKCRMKHGKCEVSGNDRYQCRACRLKKCKLLGMTPDNVQLDLTQISSKDSSFHYSLGPSPQMYRALKNPKLVVDITPLMNKLKTIFGSNFPPIMNSNYFELNALEKMRFALWNYRSERKFGDLKFEKRIVVSVPDYRWESDLIRIATWLQHSEKFRSLTIVNKMKIFKKVWHQWRKFEKWLISVDTFGQRVYQDQMIICSNYNAVNLKNLEFDFTNISDHPAEELQNLFTFQIKRMMKEVVKPLADIGPSTTEMTYMLCQLVWRSLDVELDPTNSDISEAFLNEISNNLHEYYMRKNVTNYAYRLQKMMKIVNSVKEIEREREEMMKLCMLFDVFKIKFSEDDLFLC